MADFFSKTDISQLKKILLGIAVILSFPKGFAAEAPKDPVREAEGESLEERFIEGDIMVSDWFDGIAEGIDLFLVGKRITHKRNETNVRLTNSTYYAELSGLTNSPSISVNLRLPNVEEYWNLKFTSYDETTERGVRNNQLRTTPQEKNYGASVGLFKKLGDVRTSFQPRIELRDPLQVGHLLAFESLAEFKTYRVNPRLEFYANPSKGTGIFHALNFNFRLSKKFSMTLINEGEYEDKKHLYSVTNGIALGQGVTKKTSFSYGFYLGSNNQPNYHLQSYTFAISWAHTLYNKILDYSLTPQLSFDRANSFTGVPGISFGISLNF